MKKEQNKLLIYENKPPKEIRRKLKCITVPIDIYKLSVEFVMPKENKIMEDKYCWSIVGGGAMTDNYLKDSSSVMVRFDDYTEEGLIHEIDHCV